jgi:hypothetical protein
MLNEAEFAEFERLAKPDLTRQDSPFWAALDYFERITGYRETNINAVWHHRLALYGPACAGCGKPLRTPQASYCLACGAVA